MLSKAVFLDRDGTLNYDPGYLGNIDDLKLFPDTGVVLAALKNKYQFKLIVISNQSGIARGLISDEQVISVNNELNKMILDSAKEFNIELSKSYFVGDSVADIEAVINAKLKTILVKTGNGIESISILQKENNFPSFVAENLNEAYKFIIKDSTGVTLSD